MADAVPETPPLPPVIDDIGAPVVFFDGASTFGHYNGIAAITLSVAVGRRGEAGKILNDERVAVYLRTNLHGLKSLREAIESIELMAAPVQGGTQGKAN